MKHIFFSKKEKKPRKEIHKKKVQFEEHPNNNEWGR